LLSALDGIKNGYLAGIQIDLPTMPLEIILISSFKE
jgi:hypothetical protein